MNKNIFAKYLPVILFSLSAGLSSCDEKHYDFDGGPGTIYVSTPTSTQVNSTPNTFVGHVLKTPVGVVGQVKAEFPIRSTVPVKENTTVSVGVDNGLVDAYNQKYGTTYSTLPTDMVEVSNQNPVIAAGQYLSADSVKLNINTEKVATLESKIYLVPVKITEVKGSLQISENYHTVYLLVNIAEDTDNIWDVTPEEKGNLLGTERQAWTVTTANSSFGGSVGVLFDGNSNNYLNYRVQSYDENTGFTVDMQQSYQTLSGLKIEYYSSSYGIREAEIYTSEDGHEWNLQGHVNNTNGTWDLAFYSPVSARYLKFVVRQVASYGVYFREFNVYTK